jgi:hypothetical protein
MRVLVSLRSYYGLYLRACSCAVLLYAAGRGGAVSDTAMKREREEEEKSDKETDSDSDSDSNKLSSSYLAAIRDMIMEEVQDILYIVGDDPQCMEIEETADEVMCSLREGRIRPGITKLVDVKIRQVRGIDNHPPGTVIWHTVPVNVQFAEQMAKRFRG